jgi:hypothetical protein
VTEMAERFEVRVRVDPFMRHDPRHMQAAHGEGRRILLWEIQRGMRVFWPSVIVSEVTNPPHYGCDLVRIECLALRP